MRRKGKLFIGIVMSLLITFMYDISSAEVSGNLNLEGSLRNLELPKGEGVEMIVSLFDSETAETPLWTHRQVVEVKNGIYSIVLNKFPNKMLSGAQYYIGVEIETEKGSVCLGRKRLAEVGDY